VRGCARMENKENCHWRLSGAAQSPYYQMSCASVAKRPLPHNRLWYRPAAGLRVSDRSLVPARVFAVSPVSLTAGTPGVSVGVAHEGLPGRLASSLGRDGMRFQKPALAWASTETPFGEVEIGRVVKPAAPTMN